MPLPDLKAAHIYIYNSELNETLISFFTWLAHANAGLIDSTNMYELK